MERVEGERRNTALVAELCAEKKRTGHSLLRIVAEKLTQQKRENLRDDPQEIMIAKGYFNLLQALIYTEETIATGLDHLEIIAEATGKQSDQTLSLAQRVEAYLYSRELTRLLREDPSGFSLGSFLICQYMARVALLGQGGEKESQLFIKGLWQASRDYNEWYPLGDQAGLGPLP